MRVAEALMQDNQAWAAGRQNAMMDLRYGGQMGFSPDLTQWVSNQPYVRRNLICLLLEAPTGFQQMDDPQKWVSTLRSLVELHPLSITGFQAGLVVDQQDTAPVGGGGEMHQDFLNVTQQRSTPVFRWNEKYGQPISAFLGMWIKMLMMDPHSKVAGIGTLAAAPADMLADRYSATMIFIEPDPTHTKVVKAFLCTNMWPHSNGDINGQRDITASMESPPLDITFSAITQFGAGPDALAQNLLDSINLLNANPSNRPAFVQSINSDVSATNVGYESGVEELGNTAIRV